MQAVTATEFSRNFSQMLDQVEQQGVTIAIVRNHKQNAMQAFGDLYRPLEHTITDDWLADIAQVNAALDGPDLQVLLPPVH